MVEIETDLSVNICIRDLTVLTGNVEVALPADNADVAVACGSDHRSLAGKGNIQILLHPMISGSLIVRVQRHHASTAGDLGFGAGIPFIGVSLTLGVNALVDDHANLIIVGGNNIHSATSVGNVEAGSCREGLRQLVVIVVLGSKDCEIVVIIDVDLVFELSPVEVGRLGRNQTKKDDGNNQKYSTCAEPGGARALPLRLLIFDQFDHARDDEQHGPVVREPAPEIVPVQHAHCAE